MSKNFTNNFQIQGFQPSIQNYIKNINIKNTIRDYNLMGAPNGHFYYINNNGIDNEEFLNNQRLIYAQADSMLNTKSHPSDMGYEVQDLNL